ncbi:GNAT family N-acetyltransferase [Virgibacillus sp. Bac332]|nr:GNAT family N-acetyltransferase [Virgibacillus sp. Bac332]
MTNSIDSIIMEYMKKEDWPEVRDIYIEGIKTGNATFDTEPPTWDEWNSKYLQTCRLVVREHGRVVGWAALLPISSKKAHAGVAELSIYLGAKSRGKGLGRRLMEFLVAESEAAGFWTLQSGVFPENVGSIYLHEKAGFYEVGIRKRIGKLDGVWRDVILLERRSKVIG